jgi:hypothetical protein
MPEEKVGFAVLAEEWEAIWAGWSWQQLNPLTWTLQEAFHPKNIKCVAQHHLKGRERIEDELAHPADNSRSNLAAALGLLSYSRKPKPWLAVYSSKAGSLVQNVVPACRSRCASVRDSF